MTQNGLLLICELLVGVPYEFYLPLGLKVRRQETPSSISRFVMNPSPDPRERLHVEAGEMSQGSEDMGASGCEIDQDKDLHSYEG